MTLTDHYRGHFPIVWPIPENEDETFNRKLFRLMGEVMAERIDKEIMMILEKDKQNALPQS